MEGESGEQVGGELESVTSSAECFVQGWQNETGSWFQRWGDAQRNERLVILREEDVGGREKVTTDEERVARGAEQRPGCADK